MDIMIVDDSAAMRLIVQKTMRAAGYDGHDYRQAADGAEALEMILDEEPDLILCDWNMPNMTGPELLQALNNEGVESVFGFVTTEATPAMREKAKQLGADFLISKPFTPEDFEEALDEFFE
jgi:two-component system chemotaxis response regulator CheY